MDRNHILISIAAYKTSTGKLSFNKLKHNKLLIDQVKERTLFLPNTASFTERLYCIENNITDQLKCETTGKLLKFNKSTKQYNNTKEHVYRNRQKAVTNIIPIQNNIIKELYNRFNNKNYQLVEYHEIIKKINNLTTSKNINPYVVRKHYDLFCSILNYTPFISGLNWGERIYCIRNGITSTPVDIYGMPLTYRNSIIGYSKYSNQQNAKQCKIDNILTSIKQQGFNLVNFNRTIDNHLSTATVKCNTCNTFKTTLVKCGYWNNIYCSECYGVTGRSKIEEEICRFLQSYNLQIVKNTRSIIPPYELDIYLPSHNLAIEVNGVLWHSIGTTYPNNIDREKYLKNLHINKHTRCKMHGIQLISIFDNEWVIKQEIVKSIILAKLHIFTEKIYARKCMLTPISTQEANSFYDVNHLQGGCRQISQSYCLKYNDVIVSCISFGKRKITKGLIENELVRFCNKLNTQVIGGGSKLFAAALHSDVQLPIISYCDKRYGNGQFYEVLGFKLMRESLPNYWYTLNGFKLLHRSNFQKHKISNNDNIHKTEKQIMIDNGYRIIYDCGNYVFKYDKNV